MKIVCDACQAKYSISDDKVQGKVFKIRCKKCSNIIVVRGGASEQPQQAAAQEKDTRVFDYGYEGLDANFVTASQHLREVLDLVKTKAGTIHKIEFSEKSSFDYSVLTVGYADGVADLRKAVLSAK